MRIDAELSAWRYSPQQLAREAKVTLGLIYRKVSEGSLSAVKIDGVWRIEESAAQAYIEQHRCRMARASAPAAPRRTRCTGN
jgi:excisionase family DNA binding protein